MSAIGAVRRLGLRSGTALLCLLSVVTLAADDPPASAKRASSDGPIELDVGGAHIRVALDAGKFRIGAAGILEWVRRSATIVAGYYGRFPVRTLDVSVSAVDGGGVHGGRAFPAPGIRIGVGREASSAELMRDWVLVHEMIHLALPDVGEEHAWLSEGLATYVEGIARVQAGNMTASELWQEYVGSMPKGLPTDGDRGLDRTHTWARTYWGGALFCLAADVAIREATANRRGLQDALRAVARASGGLTSDWPVERVFSTGDEATGTHVLSELYRTHKEDPAAPDMAALWRRLGIASNGGALSLANGTPEAEVREAITRSPTPAPGST
jgi:hypothetical protein